MAYCFDELENYAVTPMLATPCVPDQCCERSPVCCASLPRCQKGEIVYVEKPQTKCYKKTNATNYNCCSECSKQSRSPEPLRRQTCCSSQEYCPTCNKCNPCKSIKTKYVIPCYRYEDGRIVNPMPSSAFKRNGIQDQNFRESGGISYIRKSWESATWSYYPFAIPVKPMKKLSATVSKKR
ncbi:uncharacterized protein LOC113402050 isoform X3 [Vanessa tameamea]|uniref:Uncharacterized protein LOC113402050 isoform X3 n=1 Tax=Vanessa tameamea TaxID=334116 RepID=A0ABM4ASW1_VANTA